MKKQDKNDMFWGLRVLLNQIHLQQSWFLGWTINGLRVLLNQIHLQHIMRSDDIKLSLRVLLT